MYFVNNSRKFYTNKNGCANDILRKIHRLTGHSILIVFFLFTFRLVRIKIKIVKVFINGGQRGRPILGSTKRDSVPAVFSNEIINRLRHFRKDVKELVIELYFSSSIEPRVVQRKVITKVDIYIYF